MTEEERLLVVERVNNDLELQKIRKQKKERREELKQNEAVREYLKISNEIGKLNKELKFFKSKEEMTELEFICAFNSKIKNEGFLPCNHEIWIYSGSFGLWEDPRWEHDHNFRIFDESDKEFGYNEYICLECGKVIKVEDYEEFEKNNFVLKNRRDMSVTKYQSIYYQLLYTNTVKDSQRMVIDEFNKNLTKKKIK